MLDGFTVRVAGRVVRQARPVRPGLAEGFRLHQWRNLLAFAGPQCGLNEACGWLNAACGLIQQRETR